MKKNRPIIAHNMLSDILHRITVKLNEQSKFKDYVHACIPANAESAAATDLAEMSLPTLSACDRSNRPFKNARRVNSPIKKIYKDD